jgi:hypothetical protein
VFVLESVQAVEHFEQGHGGRLDRQPTIEQQLGDGLEIRRQSPQIDLASGPKSISEPQSETRRTQFLESPTLGVAIRSHECPHGRDASLEGFALVPGPHPIRHGLMLARVETSNRG